MEEVIEYIPWESKPGYYEVFEHPNGKKYIVPNGLSIEDIHEPGILEQWTQEHYAQLETMYWILFIATFVYLIGTYIVLPLIHTYKTRRV